VISFKKNRRIRMKKTLVSIAAASLIVTSAMAADKGIDIVTTGQAVVYYETNTNDADASDTELFDRGSSKANVGIQLNLDADLKNGFTFGSQLSYLGTAGLEGNLVSDTVQYNGTKLDDSSISEQIALSKIFIAKKIANTTVKIGRQELPKSLSPFAFSEGWSVFKNTFEAILAVNSDIPDTTLVGAYVTAGNTAGNTASFATFDNTAGVDGTQSGGIYMLTAQNKSIPMTTVTATYYDAANLVADASDNNQTAGASVMWLDVKVASKDLPMGLNFGLQAGTVASEAKQDSSAATYDDTSAYGLKVGMKPIKALALSAAYTSVNDGTTGIVNLITGNKTPLYTQMIANQSLIYQDNNTMMLKGVYNTGDYGKIIAVASMTDDASSADVDYTEFDLAYKIKAGNVNYLAAYVHQTWDRASGSTAKESADKIRLVARYNF
jgi:hypothetical protein